MPRNVKVPWETRLGNIGEAEVKSRLSYFSIVTKYDTDVGIDFYCELVEDDFPSIPFYVQAKGTEHFDENWEADIKKTTVMYWLQQPSPVFLIVHDEKTGNCHWLSIEDYRYILIESVFKTNSEKTSLKMDRSHILEKGKGKNSDFIRKIKEDLVSTELFRGHPLFKGEGYIRLVPDPPRSDIELQRIKENIRGGLYSLLIYYFFFQRDLENAFLLGEFLTKFDKSHYNHFVWFGQINKALGNKEYAKKSFEEALRICERDQIWPKVSMEEIIARIKKDIESCK
jgi:hypothetical protein